jgi:lipoate-protein ligase A
LIDTDFSDLWTFLKFDQKNISCKSVSSVKSKVVNLSELQSKITIESVIKSIAEPFADNRLEEVNADEGKFASWQWIYGQTPEFIYEGINNLRVKAGKVVEINGNILEKMEQFKLD